jgi:hypothetical protein
MLVVYRAGGAFLFPRQTISSFTPDDQRDYNALLLSGRFRPHSCD